MGERSRWRCATPRLARRPMSRMRCATRSPGTPRTRPRPRSRSRSASADERDREPCRCAANPRARWHAHRDRPGGTTGAGRSSSSPRSARLRPARRASDRGDRDVVGPEGRVRRCARWRCSWSSSLCTVLSYGCPPALQPRWSRRSIVNPRRGSRVLRASREISIEGRAIAIDRSSSSTAQYIKPKTRVVEDRTRIEHAKIGAHDVAGWFDDERASVGHDRQGR